MARELPDCPDVPTIDPEQSGFITESFDIHVVTPLFGGGVKAGENDPITVIRGSSIRGHLRFWWRATRGAACESWKTLNEREKAIWGSSKVSSNVSLQVQVTNEGRKQACAEFIPGRNFPRLHPQYPAYVIFPFTGNTRENKPPAVVRENVAFKLKISFPKNLEQDVKAALWAWINFGGIGSRTRRGCGSLHSPGMSPPENIFTGVQNQSDISQLFSRWVQSKFQQYSIVFKGKRPWPILHNGLVEITVQTGSTIDIWNQSVKKLENFRQGSNLGRNPGTNNRPGRSRWPEAESVRNIFGQRSRNRPKQPEMPTPYFPRALFGLPIILHFKDRDDPTDITISPDHPDHPESQRFSSPIIIKPLAYQSNRAVGLIILLITDTPPNLKVAMKGDNRPFYCNASRIRVPEIDVPDSSPLRQTSKSPEESRDALIEFFTFFKKQNKKYE